MLWLVTTGRTIWTKQKTNTIQTFEHTWFIICRIRYKGNIWSFQCEYVECESTKGWMSGTDECKLMNMYCICVFTTAQSIVLEWNVILLIIIKFLIPRLPHTVVTGDSVQWSRLADIWRDLRASPQLRGGGE